MIILDNNDVIVAAVLETAAKVSELVDKAAAAGDRWLFLATLVLLLSFAALVIWFLVKRSEMSEQENKVERKEIRDEMEKERVRFSDIIDGYRVNLNNLTSAVDTLNRAVASYDRDMRTVLMHYKLIKEVTENA